MAVLRRDFVVVPGPQTLFHDLGTTDFLVQIRDENNYIVWEGIETKVTANSVTVEFDEIHGGHPYSMFLSY